MRGRGPARRDTAAAASTMRLAFVGTLVAGCFLLLLWRLYTFQVLDTDRYRQLASDERRAQIPIVPRRGSLLDAGGNPLAMSVMYDSVWANGPSITDPDRTAAALSPVLGMPAQEIRARLDRGNKRPVVLRSRVHSALSQQVRQLRLPGIYLEHEPIREYPEGSLAAQLLGFVGRDFSGLAGLELSYDDELAGTPGLIDTEQDTAGQEIVSGRRVLTPPREGVDLVLTLDRNVQRTAERLLAEAIRKNNASGGVILVMEPTTGSLLAAASEPTYSLTAEEIYRPGQEGLYKPIIATNQYEPGSTMKVITMAAAIDEGVVAPSTSVNDTGAAAVAGAVIRNWDGAANGMLSMTGVLIKSSNVGTQWVAGRLGPDRFYHYLEAFGFGQPAGVRLPGEAAGLLRTHRTEGWTRIDLATNSYGQGVAVTPLQMLTAIASLGNDGLLMQPRLVREMRGPQGTQVVEPRIVRQVVSPRTARTLREMMVEVAEQEGLRAHRLPGYRIALKTGTSDMPTAAGYDTGKTYASVAALLPADAPRFAVLIRIDSPEGLYGGVAAAPVLKQLAQELFAYYRIPPTVAAPATSATN